MPRPFLALSAVLVAGALAAPAAAPAKGDVTATITAPTTCPAAAGRTLTITFSLATADGEPFGASGLFVRLRRTGGRPSIKKAARPTGAERAGEYAARVTVPRGGIRRIDVGLTGWVTEAGGRTRESPHHFPVVGDPCRPR